MVLIAHAVQVGREIALSFVSCYFTPFQPAQFMILIPNTTARHPITYTYSMLYQSLALSIFLARKLPSQRASSITFIPRNFIITSSKSNLMVHLYPLKSKINILNNNESITSLQSG